MRLLDRLTGLIPGQRPPRVRPVLPPDLDAGHRAVVASLLRTDPAPFVVVRSELVPGHGWQPAAVIGYTEHLDTAVAAVHCLIVATDPEPGRRWETCTLSVLAPGLAATHALRVHLAARAGGDAL